MIRGAEVNFTAIHFILWEDVCGLLNDVVSNSGFIALDDRMIDEL
jgi:hypothetical protein